MIHIIVWIEMKRFRDFYNDTASIVHFLAEKYHLGTGKLEIWNLATCQHQNPHVYDVYFQKYKVVSKF